VAKKTECEKGEIDDPIRKDKSGQPKKIQTCLIKADVYVERGFRLLIYRDTNLHFVGNVLKSVMLGELEKAWKAGGVPAPTEEQILGLLKANAQEKLGAVDAQVTILEAGRPRLHRQKDDELFRDSILVSLSYRKDGAEQKRDKVLVTLQSDGTDWKVIPELGF
jgi:hypothetical protein